LYFHGNAGNVSHRLDRSKRLVDRFGVDILLLDYRGYGRSEGRPSEAGLYRDARAAYAEALRRGFPPDRIVLFGESLGCSVAVQLATEKPSAGLVLETPFLSVPALARKYYPMVPGFVIRTRFDSEKKIAGVAAPKLFIQAENDEIVPGNHARRLHELAPPPKELYRIPRAGHNDTYVAGGEDYLRAWERFLRSISAGDGDQ
ncbi:MAG: alpha/beta hydrolase, partial [Thermoanaerobaculia bacterium]